MRVALARVLNSLARIGWTSSAFGGPVDSLLQKFENCRAGLTDGALREGGTESFFRALYEQEREVLRDTLRAEQAHLTAAAREQMFLKVDELIRGVVVPGYARLAERFTRRERNGFYLAAEPFHGAERVGWSVAGTILGALVIWAPFIPLWSKEWVLVFFLGGLFFPEVRRSVEIRRYERDLNALVARTEREIDKIDVRYLLRDAAAAEPHPEEPHRGSTTQA